MNKKKVIVAGSFIAVLGGLTLSLLIVALKHVPNFYGRCEIPASSQRQELSKIFQKNFFQLTIDLTMDSRKEWRHSFSEAQINSFLKEDFVRLGEAENLRRLGITDPCVVLEDNKLRIAFRYGSGFWSSVVSYDLRIWLIPREPNMIAVEILSRRIGALPLSSQSMLHELSELARRQNIEMSIYREKGHPVAVLRFQADRPRPTTNLALLRLEPSMVTMAGGSPEPPVAPVIETKAVEQKPN